MKALRYYGQNDVRLDEIPEPELQPGTVKITPAFTGICGSDLHLVVDGAFPPAPSADQPHPISGETLPVVFGHEFSGTVTEVADDVDGVAVGDRVVVEPYMVDGTCDRCKEGNYNLCVGMGFIGISGRGGGLSESIVVEKRWVHPVGDMELDHAALIEPLAVAVHGVRISEAKAGDVALVGGAGPIGLLTAAVLKAKGATVLLSEVSDARKTKAEEARVADHILDPTEVDVVEKVRELTGGNGADVAFECAGVQAVTSTLTEALRQGGVLQVIALFSKPVEVDMVQVVLKELQIRGAIGYCGDHPEAIALVQEGKVDLAPFITAVIGADEYMDKGIETLHHRNETAVKILVKM